ncbi:Holliday junction branch migration protein RuvA [Marinospirillum sp.]|uniref:Holliday junction branch migration protein RuvA n=1 Tax=Marinospirillum sp. TaxID=2183934 RepID=UPI003A84CAF1
MIGRLQGQLIEKQPSWAVIDVQGVGYEVELPLSVFAQLPELEQPLTLWIHHLVREDAQLLYGFMQLAERQLFRELIKVSGIGPKVALALLSSLSLNALLHAVQQQDVATLTRVPGIGKKTAERLLLDLKDRLKAWSAPATASSSAVEARSAISVDPQLEAEAALVALGYKPADAAQVIKAVAEEVEGTSELIRAALKRLAR